MSSEFTQMQIFAKADDYAKMYISLGHHGQAVVYFVYHGKGYKGKITGRIATHDN